MKRAGEGQSICTPGMVFVKWGKEKFPAHPGDNLLNVIRAAGLAADCGGKGTCGQCRLCAFPGEHLSDPTAEELLHLGKEELKAGWRLSCQARLLGDIEVTMIPPAPALFTTGPILSSSATPGPLANKVLGLAVDIGTTNISAYLADLGQKKIIARAFSGNPQRVYGADVISRIAHAGENEETLESLRDLAVKKINDLTRELLSSAAANPRDVREVVILGNNVMQHIFSGISPASLGSWPYAPAYSGARDGRARDYGLELPAEIKIFIFPAISGFLGGDALGAMISQNLPRRKKLTLLVDIGTNGEIILAAGGSLWGASCATGPAFEGAHLKNGITAAAGAISRVRLRRDTEGVRVFTIDGASPRGICGSGLVDLLAELRLHGLLNKDGLLAGNHPRLRADREGKGKMFVLVAARPERNQSEIAVTQGDIRELQLAKAALASGIELLCEEAARGRPEKIILTGAFGVKFNWRNALAIGLLPDWARFARISAKENAAAHGALWLLFNPRRKNLLEKLASQVAVLDLAAHPLFFKTYTDNLSFP